MNAMQSLKDDVIQWRRHLHENPELSYQEYETAAYIYNVLQTFPGLEVSKPTETSVLAVLQGEKQSSEKTHTILFRADIDALPIGEETDFDYKSKNPGVMHACGHDAHAAMLLGAVKALSERRDEISGEIRFIFQHAEEVTPGGAQELVKKGVADGVDYAFALHVTPYQPTGTICIRDGVLCAAADDFEIKIIGQGGHASTPELAIDPVIVGAEVTSNIQYVVSRKIAALRSPVVTVTKFHSGDALNVIPQQAELGGTIRSLDAESRVKAREYLEQIVEGITKTHGADYEIKWDLGYPAVVNTTEAVEVSRTAVEEVCGKDNLIHVDEPMFGTEDFSSFSQAIPASMQFIGVHDEKLGKAYPLHHPKLKIDENALQYGVDYYVKVAEKLVCS